MDVQPSQFSNITEIDVYPIYAKIFWRALKLMLAQQNRSARKQQRVSSGDALFNFIKLSFLETTVLKYRHMVRFGDSVILDSTFPPFPSRAFDKRISNYLNNLDMTRLPSGIASISTTNSCPYACAFCSTNAKKNGEDDLDEEVLKRTISQLEALGIPSIILHGGEPMLRYERFLRLVRHVSDDACLWMFTTGYGVDEEKAGELKANGLFGAWVSLDHYDPDVHNRLRGNPDAFNNAVRAVENFKRAGVYTCLSLVPPEDFQRRESFEKYYDLAKELGVAEIRVMEKKPSGREACRGVKSHSPSLERLQKDLFKDPRFKDHPPLSGLSTWLETDTALGCQCRFEYLFITSTGEVQPCEATQISFGNIAQEPFLDIYQRMCKAFPKPSTGCIPMVMFPEVQDYQKIKDQLASHEKSAIATEILREFQERGAIPGAYKLIWTMYERRLSAYRHRLASENHDGTGC